MKKKTYINALLRIVVVILVLVIPITVFAEGLPEQAKDSLKTADITAEETSDIITDIVEEQDVVDDVEINPKEFIVESEEITVSIPRDEDESVVMCAEGNVEIHMGLPEEVEQNGVLTDNGTVVFDSDEKDVQVAVQVISDCEVCDDAYAVRTMIVIDNADASHEYEFPFELPQGYSLITDYDYHQTHPTEEEACGEIFIIDEDEEIVNVIESAWAVDANQMDIPTHYEIQGNTLVQIVDFDENTAFPVVADPVNRPTITRTIYLTKPQVLKIRNQYTGSSYKVLAVGVVSFGVSFVPCPPVGAGWALATFAGGIYYSNRFSTWDKIYTRMNKKYAKVTIQYRWVGGSSRSNYIPTGKIKCEYTNKMK